MSTFKMPKYTFHVNECELTDEEIIMMNKQPNKTWPWVHFIIFISVIGFAWYKIVSLALG